MRRTLRAAVATALALVCLAALVVGAGGVASGSSGPAQGASAAQLLRRAFASGHEVRSGRIDLSLRVGGTSVRVRGPFEAGSKGRPARFDISLSTSGSGTSLDLGLVSAGGRAYLRLNGKAYDLGDASTLTSQASLSIVPSDIDARPWLKGPRIAGNVKVGGVQTVHVASGVDTGKLLAGLDGALDKAGGLGAAVSGLDADARRQVRKAARNARVDLWIGRGDDVLRRLRLSAGGLSLDVTVSGVGEPQDIAAPAGARPLSDAAGGLGALLQGLTGASAT